MNSALTSFSNDLAGIVESTSPFVAAVHGRHRGGASGILWKPGVIVTCEHPLRRTDEVRVTLPDGRTVAAKIVGRDPGTDLAVLKIDDAGATLPIPFETAEPRPGELVLALGRTAETGVNAALGIVSGVANGWTTWRGGRVDRYLRLDIQLFSGSAGGAIVSAPGKLLGLATPALSRIAPLAIPVATIERVVTQILEKGHVARGYLGVGLQPIALPEHLKQKLKLSETRALIALSVEPDAAAGKAGLQIGDILVALDGKPVTDTDAVQAVLGSDSLGKTVKATIVRGGEMHETPITIGERPAK